MLKSYTFHVGYNTRTGLSRSKEVTVRAETELYARQMARDIVYNRNRTVTTIVLAEPQPEADPFDGFTVGQKIEIKSGEKKGLATVRSLFFTDDKRPAVVVESRVHGFTIRTPGALRRLMEEPETVEYHAIYPDGGHYTSDRPVKSSSYGIENLIQIRVTKRGDKIVKKEIV